MEWAACGTFGGAGGGCVQTDGTYGLFQPKPGNGGYQGLGVRVERWSEDPFGGTDFDKFA